LGSHRFHTEELKSILGQPDVVVVDVRVAEKWLVLKIRDQDPIPKIEGVEIRVKEVVAA
jgi:rhodanese-related sulfurtransferase